MNRGSYYFLTSLSLFFLAMSSYVLITEKTLSQYVLSAGLLLLLASELQSRAAEAYFGDEE